MIGGLTIISGAFCNTFFRQRMKLFEYNRIITLVSSSILPAMTAIVLETGFVMKPILLRDYDCPMCIQVRAAAGQVCGALSRLQCRLRSRCAQQLVRYVEHYLGYNVGCDPRCASRCAQQLVSYVEHYIGYNVGNDTDARSSWSGMWNTI